MEQKESGDFFQQFCELNVTAGVRSVIYINLLLLNSEWLNVERFNYIRQSSYFPGSEKGKRGFLL